MAESFFGRLRQVVTQRNEIKKEALVYPAQKQGRDINPNLFKYFFDTQVAIEREGVMDYHKYAAKVWQELVTTGEVSPIPQNDPQFKRFEGNLILGLHDIDMKLHTYSELVESLGQMIARYGKSVKKVAIWTTGDNLATGYQPAKVARSGIISAFSRSIKTHLGEDSKKMKDSIKTIAFMAEKTECIVSDNKFKELDSYLNAQSGPAKLVAIEDSRSNLRKVQDMINKINQSRHNGDKLEFIPVWATYSREGKQAREKAEKEGKLDELEKEKREFHAIGSPADLLEDRFETIFSGADIFVDFDGVIGNNLTMREAQARVKYNVLVSAITDRRGVDVNQADKILLDNLVKLPQAT